MKSFLFKLFGWCDHPKLRLAASTGAEKTTFLNIQVGVTIHCDWCGKQWIGNVKASCPEAWGEKSSNALAFYVKKEPCNHCWVPISFPNDTVVQCSKCFLIQNTMSVCKYCNGLLKDGCDCNKLFLDGVKFHT